MYFIKSDYVMLKTILYCMNECYIINLQNLKK